MTRRLWFWLWLLVSSITVSVVPAYAMVNEVTSANRYTGNGSTTAFAYTWRVLLKTDIEVLVAGVVKTVDTDYTVTGLGASGGGSVTFVTAPANAATVTLLRKQPVSQASDYVPNEAFPAERIEKDLDKLAMQSQQQKEALDRAIKLPKTSTLSGIDFPVPGADKYIKWNATGTALEAATAGGGGSGSLPSDPTACTSGQYVTDQNEVGTLTCAQVAFSQVSGAVTDAQVPNTITVDLATLATTATALAANGANCTVGNYPLGVDASGAVESCTALSAGTGDVVGPSSSVDNGIVRYNGTTGKLVQGYTSNTPTCDDAGICTFVAPAIGAATATTVNKVTITAPATTATLTIVEGATLTASASATVSGTNTGDQTITLTGDVTGTGVGTFAATIAANSVALSTDTTGDYVSSATTNQGLLLTGTEGASLGLIDCAAAQVLKRNAGDTAWECAADSTGGAPAFNDIASGSNTTAAMVVGAGSSLRSAAGILGIPNSVTPPATSTVGDVYFDSDAAAGSRLLLATATDTMTGIDNPFGTAIDASELAAGFVDATTDLAAGLCINGDVLLKAGGVWTCATPGTGITNLGTPAQTGATQTFAAVNSGTDFTITSAANVHSFNLPSASTTNRGLVTTGGQTFGGEKSFPGYVKVGSVTGGDYTWVEALSPFSTSIGALVSVTTATQSVAGTFASRNSTIGTDHLQVTVEMIANNDLTSQPTGANIQGVWTLYQESWRQATAASKTRTHGTEIAIINKGALVDTDPYNASPDGLTEGLRVGVGKPGQAGQKISTGIALLNVEQTASARMRRGILIGNDAIEIISGVGTAIGMATNHAIQWYSAAGVIGPMIRSDVTTASQGLRLVFQNNYLQVQSPSAVELVRFSTTTGIDLSNGIFSAAALVLPVQYNSLTQGTALTLPLSAGTFTGSARITYNVASGGTLWGNAIVGEQKNNAAASTTTYPAGVTGYGTVLNTGNQTFGIFGRADLPVSSGVATNELNSFNVSGVAATAAYPPNRNIGTTERLPIALTVAAGGNASSAIGIHLVREGSAPQQFRTGIYMNPDAITDYGLFIDSDASNGAGTLGGLIKSKASVTSLQVQTVGTVVSANAMFLANANGTNVFAIKQGGYFCMRDQSNSFRTVEITSGGAWSIGGAGSC